MQGYQARVAALLVETQLELRQRLRSARDLDGIEAAAKGVADAFARRLVEDLLAGADEVVAKSLPRRWRVVGFRTRNLLSTVGPLRLKRRLYRDHKGRARLPLDEELGIAPQVRATARLQEVAVELCSRVPFRVAADLLRKVLPAGPSPVALHRLVAKVGEPSSAGDGATASSGLRAGRPRIRRAPCAALFVEADGKWVHLQQTRGHRDLELYLGLAHEGWEPEGRDRWRLKAKQLHLDVGGKVRFWEGFSARLAERYDLRDTRVVLNGDGADWVREGPHYFHRACGQLDRFHLGQSLRRVLDGPEWRHAFRAACRGELLPAVRAIMRRGHPDGPAVIQYLLHNRSGLADYRLQDGFREPGLRGLGAAEANIDKVIANRMSKRGMAWTIAGAHRMAKVLEATHNRVLPDYLARPRRRPSRRRPLRRVVRPAASAPFEGMGREETLRHSWGHGADKRGLGSMLRRIGRPTTLWEQN